MSKTIQVTNQRVLNFVEVFPNEKTVVDPSVYLKGASKERMLRIAILIMKIVRSEPRSNYVEEELKIIFGSVEHGIGQSIYNHIQATQNLYDLRIFNLITTLHFFEYCYDLPNELEEQTSTEANLNFLKAYLTINSHIIKRIDQAAISTERLPLEIRDPIRNFCSQYPYADKTNSFPSETVFVQLYKAIAIFKFMEARDDYRNLLSSFLKSVSCESWKQYLQFLATIIDINLKTLEGNYAVLNTNGQRHSDIYNSRLDSLAINSFDETSIQTIDFLPIRGNPVYKESEGTYMIVFDLFLYEKIFKNLYFALDKVNGHKKQLFVKDLKGQLGKKFHEEFMLYDTIPKVINDSTATLESDVSLKVKGITAPPDYFVRLGNKVLLIESKDFLIRKEVKMSFDFDEYNKAFRERLHDYGGKGGNPATKQLVDSIHDIQNGVLNPDEYGDIQNVIIYPILLTHDNQYECLGFNFFINILFQERLEESKDKIVKPENVRPLVSINIDTLIYHQKILGSEVSLFDLLDEYIEISYKEPYTIITPERDQEELNNRLPFSIFMRDKMLQRGKENDSFYEEYIKDAFM